MTSIVVVYFSFKNEKMVNSSFLVLSLLDFSLLPFLNYPFLFFVHLFHFCLDFSQLHPKCHLVVRLCVMLDQVSLIALSLTELALMICVSNCV